MELRTQIEINAAPEKVWNILMDFAAYSQWNPFITSIKGNAVVGEKLENRLSLPDRKPMTFKPVVKVADKAREFRWKGRMFIPGLFDGEHIFELKSNGKGGTLFVQRENFGGILVPFLKKMINGATRQGFEAMNKAIKDRAERG